jgi:Protein of unknown function (DUF3828)
MKKIVPFLIAVPAVLICAASIAPSSDSDPSETIRSFYRWYVGELIANRQPLKDQAKMKHFISGQLSKQIAKMEKEGLDYDYFTQAQDFDDLWAKNVAVSNLRIRGTKAAADVVLKGATADMVRRLKLDLELEGGDWKIDKVAEGH